MLKLTSPKYYVLSANTFFQCLQFTCCKRSAHVSLFSRKVGCDLADEPSVVVKRERGTFYILPLCKNILKFKLIKFKLGLCLIKILIWLYFRTFTPEVEYAVMQP